MKIKALEVRDSMTFIPVLAILMHPDPVNHEAERYLLRRAGYSVFPGPEPAEPHKFGESVVLVRMECSGTSNNATYDPYSWGMNLSRTMTVAHSYIWEHWSELKPGDVVDVEFILGETKQPKRSERETVPS